MNKAMFLALCYGDIFDYPLTEDELDKWQIFPPVIARRGDRNDKLWALKSGYYCLTGREKIIDLRKQRTKISQEKLLLAQKAVIILQKIPFLKMIALTGALAMENSDKDDDIDFLIITAKNRVWLTRLIAILVLELFGNRRRPHDKKFGNKICVNMFLDENYLEVPGRERNLYMAHEVLQIKPLFNKEQIYERFLLRNKWVKEYLPNSFPVIPRLPAVARDDNEGINAVLNFLDVLAYKFQYIYMKNRITREIVEKGRILFHPRDTSKMVLEEFNKRRKSLNARPELSRGF